MQRGDIYGDPITDAQYQVLDDLPPGFLMMRELRDTNGGPQGPTPLFCVSLSDVHTLNWLGRRPV